MKRVKLSRSETLLVLLKMEENGEYIEQYSGDKYINIHKLHKNKEFMDKNNLIIHSPAIEIEFNDLDKIEFNDGLDIVYYNNEFNFSIVNMEPVEVNDNITFDVKQAISNLFLNETITVDLGVGESETSGIHYKNGEFTDEPN